ncbi:hypothetical protein scyTo_0003550 [Scyliorhinus torazame]|uniref:SH2 domain-containing protein n=1 Tax=Scyliorhinus torazame TaxID=75743 RepID=A0A401PMU3_SCYTO|nr:hypothetical protein [Scyliorhinus torazame]
MEPVFWGRARKEVNGSEDEDTYEPPPTERPMRTSTTTEPTNDTYYMGSPMNRTLQDTPPILPPRSHKKSQLLTPVENIDDGEYLEFDHIESSGSKSSPDPRSQPSITPRGANLPTPVTKPPVPIGKPFPHTPSLSSEEMSIPPLTSKRTLINETKFSVLVPTPFTQSVPASNVQKGPQGTRSTGLISSPHVFAENLQSKSWYASMCDRKSAEAVLYENGKDGAFLVRPSSVCGRNQPYTLAVLYKGKVYNIPIRLIEGSNLYALGKKKAGEMRFHSVQGMIDTYQQNTLILIDQQNNTKDSTLLLYPVQL